MEKSRANKRRSLAIAGTLLFLAGSIIFMGIITGEIFYPPGYSTSVNDISDLGGTRPPNSVIYQPSATIFNITMIVTGIMIIVATLFVQKYFQKRVASIPLGIFGFGILGVGIFPGNVEFYHGLFSMITFISGGIAAITSCKITPPPYRYIGIFLGVIALVFLFFANYFIPTLGSGGTERWVAYPILLWMTGFGGFLLGMQTTTLRS
ncbi:MAG: DUF998 domain-containing protein [Nostocaceae cyanobacterium]|nr:DUF998 domain-containing protein [Nostocaceae cyanobacterium]